jgi:hypothetical protein
MVPIGGKPSAGDINRQTKERNVQRNWLTRTPFVIGLILLLALTGIAATYIRNVAVPSALAVEEHVAEPHSDPGGHPAAEEPSAEDPSHSGPEPHAGEPEHTDGTEHVDGMPGMDPHGDETGADPHGDEVAGDPHGDDPHGNDAHGEVSGAAAGTNWYVLGGFFGINLAVVTTAGMMKRRSAKSKLTSEARS